MSTGAVHTALFSLRDPLLPLEPRAAAAQALCPFCESPATARAMLEAGVLDVRSLPSKSREIAILSRRPRCLPKQNWPGTTQSIPTPKSDRCPSHVFISHSTRVVQTSPARSWDSGATGPGALATSQATSQGKCRRSDPFSSLRPRHHRGASSFCRSTRPPGRPRRFSQPSLRMSRSPDAQPSIRGPCSAWRWRPRPPRRLRPGARRALTWTSAAPRWCEPRPDPRNASIRSPCHSRCGRFRPLNPVRISAAASPAGHPARRRRRGLPARRPPVVRRCGVRRLRDGGDLCDAESTCVAEPGLGATRRRALVRP